jgi:hypothetical protein
MVGKINEDNYYVDLDQTKWNGVLRFSKELTIWLKRFNKRDGFEFWCADAITSRGWFSYGPNESEEFEHDWPNCLSAALLEVKEYIKKEN